MASRGHEISLLSLSNDSISGVVGKLGAAFGAVYSHNSKRLVRRELASFRPDVVHAHNLFPLFSPSVYDACREAGIPVVQTLHNYRLICPNALLYRKGNICESCVGRKVPWPGVLYGCYRGSRVQTAVVATMLVAHRLRGTWADKVDAYITFTDFQKEKMLQAGLPEDKIFVKPNFANAAALQEPKPRGDYALFVGRLSTEKGLDLLIRAYEATSLSVPLRIVGDGPLSESLQQRVRDRGLETTITFMGRQSREAVTAAMRGARFLVVPSNCYEGFPLTIAEAFACGLPVLASDFGSMASIIERGVTGKLVEAGNPTAWARELQAAWDEPDEVERWGLSARRAFEARFSADATYNDLMEIYARVGARGATYAESN